MKSKVLLVSLLVTLLIGISSSSAIAQCGLGDEGVCDTVRIGCPIIVATVVPGSSIAVPIYVWNDNALGGFSLGFKFDTTALGIVRKTWDTTGSVIPSDNRRTIKDTTDMGMYLIGWYDGTSEFPIPVNTTNKAKLLITLNFRVKSTATPKTITIDSSYVGEYGPFILASVVGLALSPQYVHCPEGDIVLGDPTCGDVDGSGNTNIADVVSLLNYIFQHGAPPQDPRGGDIDCDLRITVADVVRLISYVFRGGPKPCLACE